MHNIQWARWSETVVRCLNQHKTQSKFLLQKHHKWIKVLCIFLFSFSYGAYKAIISYDYGVLETLKDNSLWMGEGHLWREYERRPTVKFSESFVVQSLFVTLHMN